MAWLSHKRHWIKIIGGLACGLVLSACLAASPNGTPTPTSTPIPDVTVCSEGCDFDTIQAAIDAERTISGDIIGIHEGVYTEANITIHKNVTIQGQGTESTIIQAAPHIETSTERVIHIPAGVTVTLRGLTIQHGNPIQSPESGGGVLNEGTLTVEQCSIITNSASAGGGIHNDGTLTIIHSNISHNIARGGGDSNFECQTGGGLKNLNGHVTLRNSTVSHNTAEGKGGGIHVACRGVLILENSSIHHNSTHDDGGGIHINGVGHFNQSTLRDNIGKTGGGVYVEGSGERNVIRGQLNYTNTLIAGNDARMEKYGVADCMLGDYATLGANQNNWVQDGTCSPAHTGEPTTIPQDIGADEDGLQP